MNATIIHEFPRRARDADLPEVRERAEQILVRKLEALGFLWTDRGGKDDKAGIDVWAELPNRKLVGVDIKDNRWGEVRLEYLSRVDEDVAGWTVDDRKRTDYVLNLWPGRFWLIDFPSLKAVAKEQREKYIRWYSTKEAQSSSAENSRWRTHFVPVPVGILLADIYGQTVMGTPLTPPRLCPACQQQHPVGTTCADGWASWPGVDE